MMRRISSFGAGALFGVGLLLAGMTEPRNVLGFLDFAGPWNPRLAFVMAGAIGVHATLLWASARRGGGVRPWARRPARLDGQLVAGAAIFGVGWGLSGYCPGPAITSLGFGLPTAVGFVIAMIAGTLLADAALAWRTHAAIAPSGCLGDD
jgi:uncharacterized membrane protein YedE/YeeE